MENNQLVKVEPQTPALRKPLFEQILDTFGDEDVSHCEVSQLIWNIMIDTRVDDTAAAKGSVELLNDTSMTFMKYIGSTRGVQVVLNRKLEHMLAQKIFKDDDRPPEEFKWTELKEKIRQQGAFMHFIGGF